MCGLNVGLSVGLSQENALCRTKWTVGINLIATKFR